jgi:glycogen debranching enzyme
VQRPASSPEYRPEPAFGARPGPDGVAFSVWSGAAETVWLCLFDGERESDRIEMARGNDGRFGAFVAGLGEGARYGYRADGEYAPDRGVWFDPAKLLVDPYAVEIDRPYSYASLLGAAREGAPDTAALVPKAIVRAPLAAVGTGPVPLRPGGLIYEASVRGLTMRHPAVPERDRGTLAGLAHPEMIAHLTRIGVDAVELMPVVAWMDERHLPPLGLSNAWGYNPVTFMALDPRLAPGGLGDLRAAVAALHDAGIAVILDLVFNHTAESDALGSTVSLRGLDSRTYYRHAASDPSLLVNDTGCGNTVACDHPVVVAMVLDTLRRFVREAGVDGFRFDLAPVLGRTADGFDPGAPLLRAIAEDRELEGRILIAEPWDPGPGGYRLGEFGPPYLEWNDRFRDDVRRFWRGDGPIGDLATRLAGSADIFGAQSRSVNFVAAHDGMSLADLVAFAGKHNEANGEDNRDGHHDDLSWNHGVEGPVDDDAIAAERRADIRAMLATLMLSRGTPMIAAGDEFGRTQRGNNNAYAQDNDVTWLDWQGRDRELEAFMAALSSLRRSMPAIACLSELTGDAGPDGIADVAWLRHDGGEMTPADWEDAGCRSFAMVLGQSPAAGGAARIAVVLNGGETASWRLPERQGWHWRAALVSNGGVDATAGEFTMPRRTVAVFAEMLDDEGSDDET